MINSSIIDRTENIVSEMQQEASMTEDINCPHVGESGGCDDCKLGLEPMSCDEEFAEFAQEEG